MHDASTRSFTGLATRFSHIFSNNVPTSTKSMNQQKFDEQRRYLLNVYSKRYFGDCVGYARVENFFDQLEKLSVKLI